MALINSDPDVIRLFLRWVHLVGVDPADLIFRLSIHESADIKAAHRFWAAIVTADESQWRRPNLKRHHPSTVRHNVGPSYVGCLIVTVRRSAPLNRRVAGWWAGISASATGGTGTIGRLSGMV